MAKRINRRNFLKCFAGSAAGIAVSGGVPGVLTPVARAFDCVGNDKILVVVYCNGGYDQHNIAEPQIQGHFDNRQQTRFQTGLPFGGANATSDYIWRSQLTELEFLYNRGEVAYCNFVGIKDLNNSGSHATAQQYTKYFAGSRMDMNGIGGFVRTGNAVGETSPICMLDLANGEPMSQGGPYRPVVTNNVTTIGFGNQVSSDPRLAEKLLAIASQVRTSDPIVKQKVAQSWGIFAQTQAELQSIIDNFEEFDGNGRFHSGFEQVAAAIRSDIGKNFYISAGGFDNHSGIVNAMNNSMTDFNDALSQFRQQMETAGLWDKVVIYVLSEFGRTARENSGLGTDHGNGCAHIVIGSDVNGGAYGDINLNDWDHPRNEAGIQIAFSDIQYELLLRQGYTNSQVAAVFPQGYQYDPVGLFS